ncbi:MAG: pyridoxal-phosphate dependent enzyme [Halobacteria archaeon]|nr:pyridoxal-phosphate dependent enzyme [Halobacteria archaeon]
MRIVCYTCRDENCDCEHGVLDPVYGEIRDENGLDTDVDSDSIRIGIWEYSDLPSVEPVTMGEGDTPLVASPKLADGCGVSQLYVKDEGHNPTGSVRDRALSVAVSVAASEGAEGVSLFSTGNGGVSAAAYAARGGLKSEVYLPSRARHDAKSLINVHGGDMNVVRGRRRDARESFEPSESSVSVAPFETPYRHDGLKTVGYEIQTQLDDVDHVVCPVGNGELFLGLDKSLDEDTRIHAVQTSGCSPVVDAFGSEYQPCDSPDTVVGDLEVADTAAGDLIPRLGRGEGITVDDSDALDLGLEAASDGVELSPSGGVAAAGALRLSENFDEDDTVVIINPASGRAYADVLRSQMMSRGV